MKAGFVLIVAVSLLLAGCAQRVNDITATSAPAPMAATIKLPSPASDGNISIEKALQNRRSIREFRDDTLEVAHVSQLLWASQGITAPGGLRTAPSAGALYPLEIYVAIGKVKGLAPGVYKYTPAGHELTLVMEGDVRASLGDAAMGQSSIKDAPIDILIAGSYERTIKKYNVPERDDRAGASYPSGVRYVHMEAGHSAQNIYVQAYSLGLGTVAIGAFDGAAVRMAAGMPDGAQPLYIMPVGRPV